MTIYTMSIGKMKLCFHSISTLINPHKILKCVWKFHNATNIRYTVAMSGHVHISDLTPRDARRHDSNYKFLEILQVVLILNVKNILPVFPKSMFLFYSELLSFLQIHSFKLAPLHKKHSKNKRSLIFSNNFAIKNNLCEFVELS